MRRHSTRGRHTIHSTAQAQRSRLACPHIHSSAWRCLACLFLPCLQSDGEFVDLLAKIRAGTCPQDKLSQLLKVGKQVGAGRGRQQWFDAHALRGRGPGRKASRLLLVVFAASCVWPGD
jgi:hypothetical protein